MEVAESLGLDVPNDPDVFHRDWLLSSPMENLDIALARFVDVQKIWSSEEVIERMTFEACEDAAEQGIRVMEFRYAPDFILDGKPELSFDKIHDAILRGIEKADCPGTAFGLIGIVQKTLSLADAARTIDFIVGNADTFVGLDFADKDTHALACYAPLVRKARDAGIRITSHAGEAPGEQAPAEVRSAIEALGAERIGHGIHIINDESVMDLVREKNVPLEVCPTSNWLTGAVPTTAAHPIRRLMDAGIPITINSDDPGLFGIDLCHEYELLHLEHGFTLNDFEHCNDIAAAKSFLPVDEIKRVWNVSTI